MSAGELAALAVRLRGAGIIRVESYAWRDLDDPEAGGSEVHAHEILTRWATAGIDIVHRTSASPVGQIASRGGYRVVRRGGRYGVFPRVLASRIFGRRRSAVAVVEIWNGVPWFSPLWAPRRNVVWLHHLHDDMWAESVRWPFSVIGRTVETRIAPRFYRTVPIMTLAESTAESLIERGFPSHHVHVVHPGVSSSFSPGDGRRTGHPSVVAVGRLAPVKRFADLLDAFATVVERLPDAHLTIVGTGPLEGSLRSKASELGLDSSVTFPGRISDVELTALYRRSWLLVSASHSEGWGMTVTEAAACATPAVVTDNHGHRIAVVDGETGRIVAQPADLAVSIVAVLTDETERAAMSDAALARSGRFSWDAAAVSALRLLVERAEARQSA